MVDNSVPTTMAQSIGSGLNAQATGRTLTFGEKAVGLTFNPSGDSRVHRAKTLCAELIDMLDLPPETPSSWVSSVFRTAAFNGIIAAQMAVVKFLTWKE